MIFWLLWSANERQVFVQPTEAQAHSSEPKTRLRQSCQPARERSLHIEKKILSRLRFTSHARIATHVPELSEIHLPRRPRPLEEVHGSPSTKKCDIIQLALAFLCQRKEFLKRIKVIAFQCKLTFQDARRTCSASFKEVRRQCPRKCGFTRL